MKKFLLIALLTIKNIIMFVGCVVAATVIACLAFLPFAMILHITAPWVMGIIAMGFLVWVAWNVAVDEYRFKHKE